MSNCTRCWAVDCRCGVPSWEASITAREKAERDAKDRAQALDQRIREAERAVLEAADRAEMLNATCATSATAAMLYLKAVEETHVAVRALRELKKGTP